MFVCESNSRTRAILREYQPDSYKKSDNDTDEKQFSRPGQHAPMLTRHRESRLLVALNVAKIPKSNFFWPSYTIFFDTVCAVEYSPFAVTSSRHNWAPAPFPPANDGGQVCPDASISEEVVL